MLRARRASPWALALLFVMLAVFSYGIARAAADSLDDLMAMTAQLDEMDRRDMQDLIEQVLKCSGAHDFACADAKFVKAAKLAHSKDDKLALADVRGAIDADKDVVRLEQQARQAEQEAREEEERAEAWANACEAQCQDPEDYNRCVTHYLRPSMCGQQHADSSGIDQTGLAIISTINKTFSDAARFNNRQQAQIDSTFSQIAADRERMRREQAERMQAQDERNRAIRGEQSDAMARANAMRAAAQQRARMALANAQATGANLAPPASTNGSSGGSTTGSMAAPRTAATTASSEILTRAPEKPATAAYGMGFVYDRFNIYSESGGTQSDARVNTAKSRKQNEQQMSELYESWSIVREDPLQCVERNDHSGYGCWQNVYYKVVERKAQPAPARDCIDCR